jgi:hypothetical protein
MPWARPGSFGIGTIAGWVRSAVRTWRVVRSLPERSGIVVMVPPVFAAAVALGAARPETRVCVDLHSGALNDARWAWSRRWMIRLLRRCHGVIATNMEILGGIDLGATPVMLLVEAAPLAELGSSTVSDRPIPESLRQPVALFPASGAADEPLEQLEVAASLLKGEVRVVATGNLPQGPEGGALERVGFLADEDYWRLFEQARVVLALTSREATSQQSATEAVGAGKPLVCTDTVMLRTTFGPCSEFCDNSPESIARAVRSALRDAEQLSDGTVSVAQAIASQRARTLARLDRVLRS